MFQGQRMFLKGGMPVSHGRVSGVAGLRRKTKIRHVQIPHLRHLNDRLLLGMTGMKWQHQE